MRVYSMQGDRHSLLLRTESDTFTPNRCNKLVCTYSNDCNIHPVTFNCKKEMVRHQKVCAKETNRESEIYISGPHYHIYYM